LIELVIAVSIMVVIMGIALPAISSETRRQKTREEIKELNSIKEAVENFFQDNFEFPDEIGDLLEDTGDFPSWAGPYYSPGLSMFGTGTSNPRKDAWNVDYRITAGGFSTFSVESAGPDREFDTDDDLVAAIDVSFIRRETTLEELDVINNAIRFYNSVYIGSDPLLPDWVYIHQKLVEKGYIPAGDSTYERDGWDEFYVPDPAGAVPVVRVKSIVIP
jgi:type II secretory pathway pseudopilin PulG